MVANSLDTPRAIEMMRRADDLPVWATAVYGFRVGIGALFHHGTLLCLAATSALLLVGVAQLTFYIEGFLTTTSGLPGFLLNLARLPVAWGLPALILTPVGICLYRHLLLGERPSVLLLGVAVRQGRGMRYLRVSLLVSGLFALAEIIPTAIQYLVYGATFYSPQEPDEPDTTLSLFLSILIFLGYVAASVASLRLTLAYPAAAVGNSAYSFRRANFDMRGITWRLFRVYALLSLPCILAIAASVVVSGIEDTWWEGYLYLLLFALGQLSFVVASIAATSRLYERRVGGEASRIAEVFA